MENISPSVASEILIWCLKLDHVLVLLKNGMMLVYGQPLHSKKQLKILFKTLEGTKIKRAKSGIFDKFCQTQTNTCPHIHLSFDWGID